VREIEERERKREGGRERERERECVCVWERYRERNRYRNRKGKRTRKRKRKNKRNIKIYIKKERRTRKYRLWWVSTSWSVGFSMCGKVKSEPATTRMPPSARGSSGKNGRPQGNTPNEETKKPSTSEYYENRNKNDKNGNTPKDLKTTT
jgi:hypothetical protein